MAKPLTKREVLAQLGITDDLGDPDPLSLMLHP